MADLIAAYQAELRAACSLATPAERRYACDTAHIRYEIACEAAGIDLNTEENQ